MGWQRVPTSARFSKQKISLTQVAVKEAGYVFVYLSYEDQSNNYVYFDDFKITHTKSNLIQGSEYYPFGMQTANSWTRESVTGNNYLANGGTELNATTQLYDLEFRNYDPALGRMFQVDPVAAKYASLTPYNYSFNNPIAFADPSGADPDPDYQNPNHQNYFHNGAGSAGYPGLTYDDVVPQSARGEFNSAFGWRQDTMLGWFAGAGNMGAYWHPGDGRLFWSGYESAARDYRYDEDKVKYGEMSQRDFYEKYPGSTPMTGFFVSPGGTWVGVARRGKLVYHNHLPRSSDYLASAAKSSSASTELPTYSHDIDFVDEIVIDGERTLGSTDLDFQLSNYVDGSINFHFNVKYDKRILSADFIEKNGENYWRAVMAHERGHKSQFVEISRDANKWLNEGGLQGDALEYRFREIMNGLYRTWQNMNLDRGHEDANKRAKQYLNPRYWDYLNTPPKFD
jgi:RHS repeat-associated protein